MDHGMMFLVLCRLCELKRATSREVADSLGLGSVKYVSLVLSRCKRRGFVDREPYKCGREHGYVYWLTEKGAEWISKKVEPKKKETSEASKLPVRAKNKGVDSRASPVLTSSPEVKEPKYENWALWSVMRENEALERQNQELSVSLVRARQAYRKCSSERDFYGWKYYSLKSQLERKNKENQSLVELLKGKDEIICGLLQFIVELQRRSKLTERDFSRKRIKKLEFKLPSIKKLDVPQLPKVSVMSIGDSILKCVEEGLAARSQYEEVDRWWRRLPSPSGSGHIGNMLWSVTNDAINEMKGVKKPRTILKAYKGRYKLPEEILRLPD